MSGYNYNLYPGPGVPDLGNNGLPLVIADANVPTQSVSNSPIQRASDLNYSPYVVESNLRTPAPVKNFKPTAQPAAPSLWHTVLKSVISGGIKTGTSYAATGVYADQGNGNVGGGVGSQKSSVGIMPTPSRESSV